MQESEEIVKKALIEKGFQVWRQGENGMPDFKCVSKNRCFYVEVKTKNDGLKINQIKCISKLLENGNKVYLCHYIPNQELELYEINILFEKKAKLDFEVAKDIHARKCSSREPTLEDCKKINDLDKLKYIKMRKNRGGVIYLTKEETDIYKLENNDVVRVLGARHEI
jgi:hypothetical protein